MVGVEVGRQGAVDIVSIDQSLGGDNIARLQQLLQGSLRAGQPLAVIDMHAIPLVDSRGLEFLLDQQEEFQRRGGTLKLAAGNELCREILRITGVGERFEMYDDVKSAVGSFAR